MNFVLLDSKATIEDLVHYDVEDGVCVEVERIGDLNAKEYAWFNNLNNNYLVVRRPRKYRAYARNTLNEMVSEGGEECFIWSYSKNKQQTNSERAMIHSVANSMLIKVSVELTGNAWSIKIDGEARKKLTRNEFTHLSIGERVYVECEGLTLTNLRATVYRYAKESGFRYETSITRDGLMIKRVEHKPLMEVIHIWLDSLTRGVPTKPPVGEFRTDQYFRTCLSKYKEKVSFRGGKVTVGKPAAHIDSNGNFIMNGLNLGPRNDSYINLRLMPLGLTKKDIE